MSVLTKEQIAALPDLLNRSTRGRRVQFMPSYCLEAKGTPFSEWDTSHETSVIRPDGSRMRGYAQHKHSDDAALDGWAPSLAATVIEQQAEIERLREALGWYANPAIYAPHPHGPAFDRRDVSYVARAALDAKP